MTPEEVANEVRAWLATAWDPERPLVEWRRILVDAGWAAPSLPLDRHGRGLPAWADDVVADELRNAGAVGTPIGVAMWLAAPTLLAHGDPDLLDRLLRPILTGEASWCQLFSEPGAGSDLAGLSTSAVRDGDDWIVNGQKVWTTSAHHADMAMLLARTDWAVPKHKGLTYFALPMHQAGIEVRPLRQMNGHASFNEVFITDAQVPHANVVGAVGDGWHVALTTLAHERRFGALRDGRLSSMATGRTVREAEAETAEHVKTYQWYPQRAGRPDLLVERGAGAGALQRDEVARVLSLARVSQWTAARAQAARALGRPPGPEGSLGKLAASHVARASSRAHSSIAGATGMLAGTDAAGDAVVAEVLVSVPAQSIAGGTDEIQRNIIGEKVLGLPREPSTDRDTPFRDVPRNAGR